MAELLADIFVTTKPTKDRLGMTVKSIRSLLENTDRKQFRLHWFVDGDLDHSDGLEMDHLILDAQDLSKECDYFLQSNKNEGLGPTINRAIAHIKSINDWYSHPTHGDSAQVAPFIVCCQDDCEYDKNWLPILASRFIAYERIRPIGFASGHNAVEHQTREVLGQDLLLKDWIRMTNVLGRREYWESLMPIPRLDPETGKIRAKPNNGMGSSVDWWLIRNHENSICKTGKTCLVVPGLVRHIGFHNSTWLDRQLPESDADKLKMS